MELTQEEYQKKKQYIANDWFQDLDPASFKSMSIPKILDFYIEEFRCHEHSIPKKVDYYIPLDNWVIYLTNQVYDIKNIKPNPEVDMFDLVFSSTIYSCLSEDNKELLLKNISLRGFFDYCTEKILESKSNKVKDYDEIIANLIKYKILSNEDYKSNINIIYDMFSIYIFNDRSNEVLSILEDFKDNYSEEFNRLISNLDKNKKDKLFLDML